MSGSSTSGIPDSWSYVVPESEQDESKKNARNLTPPVYEDSYRLQKLQDQSPESLSHHKQYELHALLEGQQQGKEFRGNAGLEIAEALRAYSGPDGIVGEFQRTEVNVKTVDGKRQVTIVLRHGPSENDAVNATLHPELVATISEEGSVDIASGIREDQVTKALANALVVCSRKAD